MKEWVHKAEVFVDRSIPYLIIVLAIIIIIELFFDALYESYSLLFRALDMIVVSFFVVDLYFKYQRIKNFKKFLKTCWLDILAVFPFVLLFRMIEEGLLLFRVSKEVGEVQSIMHTAVELRKTGILSETAKLAEEVERTGKISRTTEFFKILKPLQRFPRLLKAIPFYEKPTGKHHLHELEEIENIRKEIAKARKGIEKAKGRLQTKFDKKSLRKNFGVM